jgi:hypothetical protein
MAAPVLIPSPSLRERVRVRVRVILDITASTARFGELKLAPTFGMNAYFVNDHKPGAWGSVAVGSGSV